MESPCVVLVEDIHSKRRATDRYEDFRNISRIMYNDITCFICSRYKHFLLDVDGGK